MTPLKDKVVMITGAREGIGAACAQEFLRRGARLSLIDVAAEEPGYDDGGALWTIGDITDEKVRSEAVAATMAQFGGIDILINNAGVGLFAPRRKVACNPAVVSSKSTFGPLSRLPASCFRRCARGAPGL